MVLHCHRKVAKNPANVVILTVAVDHDYHPFMKAVIWVLTEKFKSVALYGAAPPTALEREVQALVDRLQKK